MNIYKSSYITKLKMATRVYPSGRKLNPSNESCCSNLDLIIL